ncbi:MAG: hypothetical protein JST19_20365 [Bacteroidetes bacterium]|nr:hypothetical protein [Bacteroidota bacterium]
MEYHVDRISGNAYHIALAAITPSEQKLLDENSDRAAIERYYHEAVRSKIGPKAHVASLTQAGRYPYEAVIEIFTESGSV